ncbi:MAG: NADH-quinone oxidoreductase subunit H [Verrucomicrobia bacterium Tous-C9LFEB]|nr:MAG: NADH-quinone oxidoreductase subunit H [Verrucomicrobia bacterium Tous-C9LFEB]
MVQLTQWALSFLDSYPLVAVLVAILLSTVPLIAVFPGCFAITTWLERKGLARIQNRIGPNRTGPLGILQPAADGIKMLLKEDIVPKTSDRLAHFLAPVVLMVPAFTILSVLPFNRNMIPAAVDTGVILFFALGSVSTLAVFMAGWSSRNKYSLLGGMRAIAQMVSYELPLVLSGVTVIMMTGSLDTTKIVAQQQLSEWIQSSNAGLQCLGQIIGWNVFTPWGFAGFLIFFVASLAEINRCPFDLPEADSEIVAGHLTEYSGFKYALFFMSEYVSAFAINGLSTTLFLGGWSGPNIRPPWSDDPNALLIPGFVWFFAKMFALMLVMIWIRGTLPRLRVDHLMGFAWKFLLPLAIMNIFVGGFYYYAPRWHGIPVVGWPIGFLVMYLSYECIGRLNRGPKTAQRVYHYAS